MVDHQKKYEPVEDLGLGNDMISLLHKWQEEEAMEYYVSARESQRKNVKISSKQMKKKGVSKKMIAVALAAGVLIGGTAVTQFAGNTMIGNQIYSEIGNEFYIMPTSGRITDPSTNQYIEDEKVFIQNLSNELCEKGYSIDEVAIGLDCCGIDASRVSGSTLLGRIHAKNQAFLKSLSGEKEETQRGAMKL